MLAYLLVVSALCPPAPGRADLYGDLLPEGAVTRFGTVRFYHPNCRTTSAHLPDGKTFVSAGADDMAVRYWDLATGKPTRAVPLKGAWRNLGVATVFSADGRWLASSLTGTAVWDAGTGEQLYASAGEGYSFAAFVRFSPDGATLAVGTEDPWRVTFLDWRAKRARVVNLPGGGRERFDPHADFSPDGKFLVAGESGASPYVIDVPAGKVAYQVAGGWGFSPDGKALAVLSGRPGGGTVIRLLDPATGKETSRSETEDVYTGPVRFSPDGKRVALLTPVRFDSEANPVTLLAAEGGAVVDPVTAKAVFVPPGRLWSLAFSADGKSLVSGTRVWDTATWRERYPRPPQFPGWSPPAVSPDGRTVAAIDPEGNEVSLWDTATGRRLRALPITSWGYHTHGLAFTRDGKSLVTGCEEGLFQFWDPETGAEQRRVRLKNPDRKNQNYGHAFHISADGRRAVTVGESPTEARTGRVRVWDLATGELASETCRPGRHQHLGWSADGPVVAVDHDERLWVRAAGAGGVPLAGADRSGPVVASPDGRLVAALKFVPERMTGGHPVTVPSVGVWEAASGRELTSVPAGETPAMAFMPDNRTLVVTNGGALTGWDVTTGRPRRSRPLFYDPGYGARDSWVRVTPDGRRAVTPMADGTAVVWDLTPFAAPPLGTGAAAKDLAAWWAELLRIDRPAYPAVWKLSEAGGPAVALLKEHLKPAPVLDAGRFKTLVAALGDDDYEVRERATRDLTGFGQAAAARVRQAIPAADSPEVRRRLEAVLGVVGQPVPPADELRAVRAVEVLERVASADARKLLDALAGGAEGSAVTRAAKAARERLAQP